jgi:hypothetical protein
MSSDPLLLCLEGRLEPVVESTSSNEISAQYVSCKAARDLLGRQALRGEGEQLPRTSLFLPGNAKATPSHT